MISYRFIPISSQKGVLFFETPGRYPLRLNVKDRIKSFLITSKRPQKIVLFTKCIK